MHSLKKALASLFVLATLFVAFSCGNASDSGGDDNVTDAGQLTNGLRFNLSNAQSFFAGKASSVTAARSAVRSVYDDSNVILMKIMDDGTISSAMDFQDNNISFNLHKILKNPATKEIFLLGDFRKWSSGYTDANGNYVEDGGWNYNLIRVAQDGTWYGLPDFTNIGITQEPFDESGNFYFQRTDYTASTSQSNIYKYSGGSATVIVKNANLKRVLPNGAIIYNSVSNSGITYDSYNYIRLVDGNKERLDGYSTSVYIKDKNIFYYAIEYIPKERYVYVDAAGNKYKSYDSSEYVYYTNKGAKKIYVTEVDGRWEDKNGKSYDSHVFSGWENKYYIFDDANNKIEVTEVACYYEDNSSNRYDSCDISESGYYAVKNGEKIKVEYSDGFYKDSEGNIYETYEWGSRYWVVKNGNRIEVEYVPGYWKDAEGNKYDRYDKYEGGQVYWVYEGGEQVKVDSVSNGYQDADGNKYGYDEVYSGNEYYVNVNGNEVKVIQTQMYSTDVLVAKYYDFIANTKAEAVAEADFSNLYSYSFDTSSENVFSTTFITNCLWKFEIQEDFSLKCKYNVSEKGYTVATSWKSDYNFIGENSQQYLEKFLYNGEKIYFLGTKGKSWSNNSTYNLYKIIRFGEPIPVLTDAENYAFNGNITFSDDGHFVGSVMRKSDGMWGTLSGSMEYGTYEFKEDSIFESVTDIVINFD